MGWSRCDPLLLRDCWALLSCVRCSTLDLSSEEKLQWSLQAVEFGRFDNVYVVCLKIVFCTPVLEIKFMGTLPLSYVPGPACVSVWYRKFHPGPWH